MFDLFTKTKIFSGLTSKQWVNEKMEFSGKQTIACSYVVYAVGEGKVWYKHSGEGEVTKKHPERRKLEEYLI